MALRPVVWEGVYFVSREPPTRIRCKRYTEPPSVKGEYIASLSPATIFGPVEEWEHTPKFTAVKVGGSWINVWRAEGPGSYSWNQQGVDYAYKVMMQIDPEWPQGLQWL